MKRSISIAGEMIAPEIDAICLSNLSTFGFPPVEVENLTVLARHGHISAAIAANIGNITFVLKTLAFSASYHPRTTAPYDGN